MHLENLALHHFENLSNCFPENLKIYISKIFVVEHFDNISNFLHISPRNSKYIFKVFDLELFDNLSKSFLRYPRSSKRTSQDFCCSIF